MRVQLNVIMFGHYILVFWWYPGIGQSKGNLRAELYCLVGTPAFFFAAHGAADDCCALLMSATIATCAWITSGTMSV